MMGTFMVYKSSSIVHTDSLSYQGDMMLGREIMSDEE
jgi:hypothetical protein